MSKSCIIYGGAGFIGSHIADDLVEKGYKITIFDKIKFIGGDFNNEKDIAKSIKNNDYVIHLVSSTIPSDSNLNPYYDIESNLKSSLHLFEECVKNKIKKIIFISSGGTVYGNPDKLPVKESHPTNPTSSYGIIKLTIEKYLALYRELKGLNYCILRFSNPFGPRQNPLLGQGLIVNLMYKIKHGKPIEIWGDGSIVRDFFYVKDAVKSIHKAINDRSKNLIYNISSSKGLSVNQLLRKFRKELKLDFEVKYSAARVFDVKKNILSNTLAKKYLGWEPKTDFSTALLHTWRYIVDNE